MKAILAVTMVAVLTLVEGCDRKGMQECIKPFTEDCIDKRAPESEDFVCGCYSNFSACIVDKSKGCSSDAVARICAPMNNGARSLGCSSRCSGARVVSVPDAFSLVGATVLARFALL